MGVYVRLHEAQPVEATKQVLVLQAGRDYMVFNEAHDDIAKVHEMQILRFETASHELLHHSAPPFSEQDELGTKNRPFADPS